MHSCGTGVLEMNQTKFAENLKRQYENWATRNIPGSPDVELGPRKYGELGRNEELLHYRLPVGSLM